MKRLIFQSIVALFIMLFTYTALSKISDWAHFRYILARIPYVEMAATPLAVLIPVAELIVAVLLIVPRFRVPGLWLSFGAFFMFTLFVCYLILFVPDMPCSCGGIMEALTWEQHLFINASLTILSALALRLSHQRQDSVATHGSFISSL